jgi:hypothetical protein
MVLVVVEVNRANEVWPYMNQVFLDLLSDFGFLFVAGCLWSFWGLISALLNVLIVVWDISSEN